MTIRFRRSLTTTFTQPYSTRSSARTTQVPPSAPFQVSIGGRPYDVDTEFKPYLRDAFRHRSIAAQREAIDLTNLPGEGTVNVEDLWRRGADTWTLGAGQNYLDRKTSAPNRFWESKGMETALTWQATLLPECINVKSSSEGRMSVLAVSGYVYAALGNTVYFSTNLVTWTQVTTEPGGTAAFHGWATNGKTIWMAYGAGGIQIAGVGGPTMSQYCAGTITAVGWLGTLLAGGWLGSEALRGRGDIRHHRPDTPGHTALHEPERHMALGGLLLGRLGGVPGRAGEQAGGERRGLPHRRPQQRASTWRSPSSALPLEGGEQPYSLFSYLNFTFVGTNLGIRMCRTVAAYDPTGNAGDLEAGPLQPNLFQTVKGPVRGIAGYGRFVYFGWTTYDSTSSGLGRLDLSNFVDDLAPAYTSNAMAPVTGNVLAVCTVTLTTGFATPVFALEGTGIWANHRTNKVAKGTLDSGYITYGVPDEKVALQLSARAQNPLDGTMKGLISVDQPLGENYGPAGATYSSLSPNRGPSIPSGASSTRCGSN